MYNEQTFQQNLEEVRRADLAVVELFKKRGNQACLNSARNYAGMAKGDVIANGLYIENKVDWESLYTQNICIEQKSLDRQNDWFGYIIPQYYLISRPKLKYLTSTARQTTGGDSNYKLFLIPKVEFISEAQLIEPK